MHSLDSLKTPPSTINNSASPHYPTKADRTAPEIIYKMLQYQTISGKVPYAGPHVLFRDHKFSTSLTYNMIIRFVIIITLRLLIRTYRSPVQILAQLADMMLRENATAAHPKSCLVASVIVHLVTMMVAVTFWTALLQQQVIIISVILARGVGQSGFVGFVPFGMTVVYF